MKHRCVSLGLVAGMLAALAPAARADLSVSYSEGHLAAKATFSAQGANLIVTLENVSAVDAWVPTDVLTAVYFDLDGVSLTPVKAVLTGGSVVISPSEGDGLDENGQVGGEYAFRDDLTCGPASMVIGASGLDDTLGPDHLFPGTSLWDPTSPNGLGYGIVSLADDPGTGNKKLTGQVPLVKDGVVFTLAGLPTGYDLQGNLTNVAFNYGTEFSPTPAPGAALLGAIGIAMAGWLKRRV